MSNNGGAISVTVQHAIPVPDDFPAEALFERWVNAALELADSESSGPACVTIRIVDEAESRALNADFRSIDKPTNVLAFPAGALPIPGMDEAELELGDLVICHAVVVREALEQHKTQPAHMAHMAVHGALHLIGYDHQTDEQAAKMETLETRVMRDLGFEDPY